MTRNGSLGPYPHLSWMAPGAAVPQSPVGPRRASVAGSLDCMVMGPITWSYHPSESSYAMMTAVLLHEGSCSNELMVFTRKVCSSSGSEYPAWPSWYFAAFRKLTAGRFPLSAATQKLLRSYWWFAWSVLPIMSGELGGRWWWFDVEA